jgi:hypothetical protein
MAMLTGRVWIALSFWSILSGETVIGFSLDTLGNRISDPADVLVRRLM